MARHSWLWLTLLGGTLFLLFGELASNSGLPQRPEIDDRVVIDAPIQLLLAGGDRYLAADLEAIRAAATGPENAKADTRYRVRAHRVVAQLNPCHEDNYYIANALLSWGGGEKQAGEILQRAIECRQWDWVPAFFYGFNQFYFYRNTAAAQEALEIAAGRSPDNYAGLKKNAIMIATGEIQDDRMALNYLKHQSEQATDPKLKKMLEQRLQRLEGLIALREAQQRFEEKFNRPLETPQELIDKGLLEVFPADPLGIGYEFDNGKFHLRQLKIVG